ncbi:hypothetical protein V6Z11_A10G171600 [Gossypium hirsutum]
MQCSTLMRLTLDEPSILFYLSIVKYIILSCNFDRGESSSSNSESDLEIAMLRETIANSLMNQYL